MVKRLKEAQILSAIEKVVSGDDPEASVLELSRFRKKQDIDAVCSYFEKAGDLQSYHFMLRYLSHTGSPHAFSKILDLTESENDVIREESQICSFHLPEEIRHQHLLTMLESRWDDTKLFAVHKCGHLRLEAATIPLLNLLDPKEEKLSLAVIDSLQKIKDPRSVSSLERFTTAAEGKSKDAALAALGSFAGVLTKAFLKKCLHSPVVQTREAIYLALLRMEGAKWERLVTKYLLKEDSVALKLSVLASVRSIHSKGMFDLVLRWSLDEFGQVRMIALTVFKRIRSEHMLKWLLDAERKASGKNKESLLRILAVYSSRNSVFKAYKKAALQNKDLRVKLVAIEYLGYSHQERVIPVLKKIVLENEKYAFAAAVALSHLLSSKYFKLIGEFLSLPEDKFSPIVQFFLRFVSRFPREYRVPEYILIEVRKLSESNDLRIRYLAYRCLGRREITGNTKYLIGRLMAESEESLLYVLSDALAVLVQEEIKYLRLILKSAFEHPRIWRMLARIWKQIEWDSESYSMSLKFIVKSCILSAGSAGGGNFRYLQMFYLLNGMLIASKARFLFNLQHNVWDPDEMRLLMRAVNYSDIHELAGADLNFMAGQYRYASLILKQEFLRFFSKMNHCPRLVRNQLYKDFELSDDELLRTEIKKTMSQWMVNNRKEGALYG